MEIFQQLIELDDDDPTHDFSYSTATGFFSQAEGTFEEMDKALYEKDLKTLSDKGHFLKGSSAMLGLARVQSSCTKIQHYGDLRDEEAGIALTEDDALRRIGELLVQVKKDFAIGKEWLLNWFKDNGAPVDEE
ncbi:histidine phosphotransferase [Punctularia strigosozonata HHB-11173 SS5]|uniref:histidine phosphotransferase n=1 Tax=Punctularia strigosozonata (strain HHB-11173) TaxID=741275 RepID=UPI000441675B|nr:histidine phosphotransferase [Punctularia strigosozonata HHB-11173 SS5]EIN06378.1 histidine phosphotransferase [Punctularia strigosozonata HHB-11173 SS5]